MTSGPDKNPSHGNDKLSSGKRNNSNLQRIWDSVVTNYEMIQGAQFSNSFIILLALSEANEPLTTTQISEIITKQSSGNIYKISSTLKDSLEHRLKREGYVQGADNERKSLYSITPKGIKLLAGWISFLTAYS
jgi:DNA-binding PadR family transcriptional regulator